MRAAAGPCERSDFRIRGDYTAALGMARTQYAAGPNAIGRASRENGVRFGRDGFEVEGAPPTDPDLLRVLTAMHDHLAQRTTLGGDLSHRIAHEGLADAVASLEEHGYCVLENAASEQFADELREALVECIEAGGGARPAAMLLERGRLFEEAALHSGLLALAEHLCGRGFLLAQLLGQKKGPGPSSLPLHSDYNMIREPFPEFVQNCTAIWALEDFALEAGPTLVVPGSHKLARHPRAGEGVDEAIAIEMPRGSIALWTGATWHAHADRTRRGERISLHATYSRMPLRTYDFYRDIDPAILDRNPPELTTLAGLDDVFEKNRHDGPDFQKLSWANRIYRS